MPAPSASSRSSGCRCAPRRRAVGADWTSPASRCSDQLPVEVSSTPSVDARRRRRLTPGEGLGRPLRASRPDPRAATFGRSIEVDAELALDDLAGSIAHVAASSAAGILSAAEAATLVDGLGRASERGRRRHGDLGPRARGRPPQPRVGARGADRPGGRQAAYRPLAQRPGRHRPAPLAAAHASTTSTARRSSWSGRSWGSPAATRDARDARPHPRPARPARAVRPSPAGLRGDARARPGPARRCPAAGERLAARLGRRRGRRVRARSRARWPRSSASTA